MTDVGKHLHRLHTPCDDYVQSDVRPVLDHCHSLSVDHSRDYDRNLPGGALYLATSPQQIHARLGEQDRLYRRKLQAA